LETPNEYNTAVGNGLEHGIDAALSVLANPAAMYSMAPDAVKRQLVQELFETIWIRDQKLVGGEFVSGLSEDGGSAQITYDRNETRVYLRAERPLGALALDSSDPQRESEVVISNLDHLSG
jgi:hypothetical protein